MASGLHPSPIGVQWTRLQWTPVDSYRTRVESTGVYPSPIGVHWSPLESSGVHWTPIGLGGDSEVL